MERRVGLLEDLILILLPFKRIFLGEDTSLGLLVLVADLVLEVGKQSHLSLLVLLVEREEGLVTVINQGSAVVIAHEVWVAEQAVDFLFLTDFFFSFVLHVVIKLLQLDNVVEETICSTEAFKDVSQVICLHLVEHGVNNWKWWLITHVLQLDNLLSIVDIVDESVNLAALINDIQLAVNNVVLYGLELGSVLFPLG